MNYYDEPPDEWPDYHVCRTCRQEDCECCAECHAGPDVPCGVECSEWKPPVPKKEARNEPTWINNVDRECPF